jgi:hypothetical protein
MGWNMASGFSPTNGPNGTNPKPACNLALPRRARHHRQVVAARDAVFGQPTLCVRMSESVPCQGQSTQPVQVRPKEVSVHLGSYPGGGKGDRAVEALGTEIRCGRVSERTGRNASEA